MGKVLIFSKTWICTLEITSKENPRAKVYTNGKTEVYIPVNLRRVLSMVKVNGGKPPTTQNAIDLKVNIIVTKRMVWVPSLGKVAISTMVTTSTTREWATVRCTGLMVLFTKVNGKKVFKMVVVLCHSRMVE